MITDEDLITRLKARAETLDRARSLWESEWREVADFIAPRKSDIGVERSTFDSSRYRGLYDTTGIRAARTHAAGEMAWMTPINSDWFALGAPPPFEENDEVLSWYSSVSDTVADVLARSNFYSEIHESYLDRCTFGTVAMLVEESDSVFSPIQFASLAIGNYSIAAGPNDRVDTVFLCFKMTPRVAAARFGKDALSEKVQEAMEDPGKMDEPIEFRHAIYPRPADEFPDRMQGPGAMPIASVVWEAAESHLVSNSGFWELPIMVGRYLKWADSEWGVGPGIEALADIKLANEMSKDILRAVEVQIYPRILSPADHEGAFDLGPHGITFAADMSNAPRPWLDQAIEVRWMWEDLQQRRLNIENAFGVHHFQMFADLDKQMTATEVIERRSEKLNAFTPSFHRLTTEILSPLLRRVFAILVRRSLPAWIQGRPGVLPVPPAPILDGLAQGGVPLPEVEYQGVVAMAERERELSGMVSTWETLMPFNEVAPEWVDNFDIDKIARKVARYRGQDEDIIVPQARVMKIREARAAAAQEAMAAGTTPQQ